MDSTRCRRSGDLYRSYLRLSSLMVTKREGEIVDTILDTFTNDQIHMLVKEMIGFACVPYTERSHDCKNCVSCWIDYLMFLKNKK